MIKEYLVLLMLMMAFAGGIYRWMDAVKGGDKVLVAATFMAPIIVLLAKGG